jgi:hypothetical protein
VHDDVNCGGVVHLMVKPPHFLATAVSLLFIVCPDFIGADSPDSGSLTQRRLKLARTSFTPMIVHVHFMVLSGGLTR